MRFKVAAACLALAGGAFAVGAGDVGPAIGIDVLRPVEGSPWSSDRMRGARERQKDVLPGQPG